ncbi:tandem-95 repeat protein, partial [Carboxylicivirga marina]|uniref:tandem-95 repeat protein n=1 Tax=Carboxylicivirga marina TaxID=2800988 RepID=UPI0025972CD2
ETVIITLNTQTNANAEIGSSNSATVTITDSDGNLTITDASTVNGTEGGANGSFTINTSRQFTVPTTITVTTSSNSALIVDDFTISTITLDANTSDVVVPLTIINDNLAEGDETVTITLDGISGNPNAHIAASNTSTTLSITDNDIPDLVITGGPFTVDEGTSNHTFNIGLAVQPLTFVEVDISCINPDIVFSPSSITFTNADWAEKQISFSAGQDSDLLSEADDITINVDNVNSDDAFDGLTATIGLTVRDDDAAGLETTGGPFEIDEGSSGNSFSVGLAAQPASNVVVDIRSDNSDISFTPTSITFTNTNWSAQSISFSAAEDVDLIDEMNPIVIEVNNATSDDAFDNQSAIINLTVNDNDAAELSISGTVNAEEDATSGEFTINASQATLGATEITLSISGSATMGSDFETVNPTITMPDGSNSITIPINLINDNLVEGLENITIEMTAVNNTKTIISSSANSASIDISDNDIADIMVAPTTFSVTEGTSDHTFEIALSAQPISDVVIDLTSNNDDVILSTNTLTFTNLNYGNQTVSFNTLEDVDLTDESANISIAVNNTASNSLFYDLNTQVTVDIIDNDTQPTFNSSPITVTNEDAVYTYNISVTDADGDIPVITLITPSDPASTWMTLSDNGDGTAVLTGTPLQADVTAPGSPLSVTIRAEDDLTYTEQSFTITVNNINDSPRINNSSFSTPENQPLLISLSSFASDEDDNLDPSTLDVTSEPDNGLYSVNTNNGEITYTPNNTYSGEDKFNVQIQDLSGAYSNVGTITITVSNEAPIANKDSYTINEDAATTTFDVLENDEDPQNNIDYTSLEIIRAPNIGIAEVNTMNGTITYTPNANINGNDNLIYRICDTDNYCSEAEVEITITPENDAPIANDDPPYTLNEDQSIKINILENDNDVDNDIYLSTIIIEEQNLPKNGSITINTDNTIDYVPNQDFNGADSFIYSLIDEDGQTSDPDHPATVTFTVLPVNDNPIAIDGHVETYDNISIDIDILDFVEDVDGNLDLSTLEIPTEEEKQPSHGDVTINGTTGRITYDPDYNYYGPDAFGFTICDTDGECTEAFINITVLTGNAKPITNSDYLEIKEDSTLSFNPLNNDRDPDGELNHSSLRILKAPNQGSYSVDYIEPTITYTPNENFFGNDTIVYEICDKGSSKQCAQDTAFITVNPVNDDPVAVDYHLDVIESTPTVVNLAELGSDIEMEALSISISPESPSIPGFIRILNQTTLEFTPDFGTLCTTIEIKYILHDEQGGESKIATVYANVIPLDSDSDNIPDATENSNGDNVDSDQDGTPDYLDEDSDNDGISDLIEGNINDLCEDKPLDSDNDGIPDYLDTDSDNDTVLDSEEGYGDCDNDAIPNSIDSFDDCANRVLDIPETFTPNGDGINDYFIIKGATSEELKANELFIFNRWGGQVYHMVNYDNTWDGKSNSGTLGSEELSEGTYFYVFKSQSGTVIKGTVYIKR